jgi:hypothetical protein
MPHEFWAAIDDYLLNTASDIVTNNCWRLVLDLLTCAAQAKDNKSLVELTVNAVVPGDGNKFQEWMRSQLNTTMGARAKGGNLSSRQQMAAPALAVDMRALIGRSIVVAEQMLTPAAASTGGSNKVNLSTKDKYSEYEVAALLGFTHVNKTHKLPQFWNRVQASKKSWGHAMDTFQPIIAEDMETWLYNTRREINSGIFPKEKTIDSIIGLWFNPGVYVAQYTMAEQGISILALRVCSMHETETLEVQELVEERTVATRSYRESFKLSKTTVRVLASLFTDMKLTLQPFVLFC